MTSATSIVKTCFRLQPIRLSNTIFFLQVCFDISPSCQRLRCNVLHCQGFPFKGVRLLYAIYQSTGVDDCLLR